MSRQDMGRIGLQRFFSLKEISPEESCGAMALRGRGLIRACPEPNRLNRSADDSFEDNRFARNPAQGMPAVSFLFALKNLP